LSAQKILYRTAPETNAISELFISGNEAMNWVLRPDNSQYAWVGKEYGWGLLSPSSVLPEGVTFSVNRFYDKDDLIEEYTFKNTGKTTVEIVDIGINTPFNDNYPDAETCMTGRCNAHIWAGGSAAYINVLEMSGKAPHLGLALTKGSIKSYEIRERGNRKGSSNFRGVIVLNPENITLKPNEKYTLQWRIFAHNGNEDFERKLVESGSLLAKSDKYVYERGDTAFLTFVSNKKLKKPKFYLNGELLPKKLPIGYRQKFFVNLPFIPIDKLGENRIEFVYDNGKKTHIDLLCVSNYDSIISRRAAFILKNQQMNDVADERFGAFMVFDNETDKIYLNNTPNANPVDRDEGAERVGMGNFLALYYQQHKDETLKQALIRYADFLRNKLQTADYKTFSSVDKKHRNRTYNYPWIATFYFQMYEITGEQQYLRDAYGTLRSMYRQFGHKFYAIDIPIEKGYNILKQSGMTAEADSLLADFKEMGDNFVKNGTAYPRHEVNYEQSIVAPSVISLLQLYKITGEQKYLESAELQLPLLEAFAGRQPSYHLNDIAIRHWDGYWFGKREFYGDTFPHYWSLLNAIAFDYYAQITGKKAYRSKAENIARNNLCLFTEDGRGSCAYLYPAKVNGKPAQFYDPYANDQDWALYFYLQIFNNKF
jgi:hypothetical protein